AALAGRVTGVSIDPTDNKPIYLSTAGGGVWKTSNGGTTWQPLFDAQAGMPMFVGAVAVDPFNPLVVFMGTGEGNNSTDSFYGTGVYKSTDRGQTWTPPTGPPAGIGPPAA